MDQSATIATPEEVLTFWREAGPDRWFEKDEAFDNSIRARFLGTYEAAAWGDLAGWEASAEGALALVIVLDQFPRNMFRGSARMYAADERARWAANLALKRGYDLDVPAEMRGFLFLPFQHSEDLADQNRGVELYRAAGDEENLKHAIEHRDIIRRFGRFPHRNAILGRATTAQEQAFLDGGGFAG
ncbi:MAG TPA: DUF924 family protein [Xanthobacteraceae bacterium]|nr:DUF924 family protein [Xanthobacteraceae bacterium]